MPQHEDMDTDELGAVVGKPIIIIADNEGVWPQSPSEYAATIEMATYSGDDPYEGQEQLYVKLPDETEITKVETVRTRHISTNHDERDGFVIGESFELDLMNGDDLLCTVSYYIKDH